MIFQENSHLDGNTHQCLKNHELWNILEKGNYIIHVINNDFKSQEQDFRKFEKPSFQGKVLIRSKLDLNKLNYSIVNKDFLYTEDTNLIFYPKNAMKFKIFNHF